MIAVITAPALIDRLLRHVRKRSAAESAGEGDSYDPRAPPAAWRLDGRELELPLKRGGRAAGGDDACRQRSGRGCSGRIAGLTGCGRAVVCGRSSGEAPGRSGEPTRNRKPTTDGAGEEPARQGGETGAIESPIRATDLVYA